FSPGITAFGAEWDTDLEGQGTGIALLLTFADASVQTVETEVPDNFTGQFFGIVSDTVIASIRLDEGTQGGLQETFDMDNARFVVASAVPEPATLTLFGLGLLGVGAARRRKKLAA
ncbi:MAG: PEP-CTERM sorting domain-containing protein, partial [Alphaproteobacteria bacterium]|nr:PEP-CTERM sorting domain-containing protein [Alphaproteobacteria bacterium]